jgi:hypothetical protein
VRRSIEDNVDLFGRMAVLASEGLAQAVHDVILILAIDVTPSGATGFMRPVAMRVIGLSRIFSFRIVHRFGE